MRTCCSKHACTHLRTDTMHKRTHMQLAARLQELDWSQMDAVLRGELRTDPWDQQSESPGQKWGGDDSTPPAKRRHMDNLKVRVLQAHRCTRTCTAHVQATGVRVCVCARVCVCVQGTRISLWSQVHELLARAWAIPCCQGAA